MATDYLVLDPELCTWVMFPIVFIMILVPIMRTNLMKILMMSNTKEEVAICKDNQVLNRSRAFRVTYLNLPTSSYNMRKSYLQTYLSGERKKGEMDPNQLSSGMSRNLPMMFSQIVLMGGINYFFSGFVLMKLPFPLTVPFKRMLQSGIDLVDLDVTYVSAISWYYLNSVGLRGITNLILGGQANAMTPGQPPAQSQGPKDYKAIFVAEKEELELIQHSFALENIESILLEKFEHRK